MIPLAIRKRFDNKPKDKITIRMEGETVRIAKDTGTIEDSYQAIPHSTPYQRRA